MTDNKQGKTLFAWMSLHWSFFIAGELAYIKIKK